MLVAATGLVFGAPGAQAAPASLPAVSAAAQPAVGTAQRAGNDVVARSGSQGAVVTAIDAALRRSEIRNHGKPLRTGPPAVVYGPQTIARVKAFQKRNKLPATGAVDERTDALLRPTLRLGKGVTTIGRSVQRRPLQVSVVGDLASAKRRVLVVGCLHGNECAGLPILRTIARTPAPKGVAYVLYSLPNPDGYAARSRPNARGVDLNRNAIGWRSGTKPGDVYYAGASALSEPESLAIHDLVRAVQPTAFVSYHQALRCVNYSGRGARWAAAYARRAGPPVRQLPAFRGSVATWLGERYPDVVSLTVELPRPVPNGMLTANRQALQYLAPRH